MRRSLGLSIDWLAVMIAGFGVLAVGLGLLKKVPW